MPGSSNRCIFCGTQEKLTGEHVFGDWLSRIGLDVHACRSSAGPLNRSVRDFGVIRPFTSKVRDVCESCNSGWMSNLESVARRVLTPLILGNAGSISKEDAAAITTWAQKTALIGMLVSSKVERGNGYGVPEEEYWALYARQQQGAPLPESRLWIGRYRGKQRLSSIWTTPMVVRIDGLPEPELPHAYALTIVLGELLLHGVRFTVPSFQFDLDATGGLTSVWPSLEIVSWPNEASFDDEAFIRLSMGRYLNSRLQNVTLVPWDTAVSLPRSTMAGSLVRLPALCGKHPIVYPAELMIAGMASDYYAFQASCACGKTYLVQTGSDRATFKAEGSAEEIADLYEHLVGEEATIENEMMTLVAKRLAR